MGADERLRLERRLTLWAARGGHLAVLQWARANGGDWNGGTQAKWRRRAGTTRCYSGRGPTAQRPWAWTYCLQKAREGSETREWILAQPA